MLNQVDALASKYYKMQLIDIHGSFYLFRKWGSVRSLPLLCVRLNTAHNDENEVRLHPHTRTADPVTQLVMFSCCRSATCLLSVSPQNLLADQMPDSMPRRNLPVSVTHVLIRVCVLSE